jgi:2-oxoglutarate ferredoxin oxidoreductase subunit gamma
VIKVATRDIAQQAGTDKAANLVALGTYVGATDVIPAELLEQAIEQEFSGRRAEFIPANLAAFRAGLQAGREAVEKQPCPKC